MDNVLFCLYIGHPVGGVSAIGGHRSFKANHRGVKHLSHVFYMFISPFCFQILKTVKSRSVKSEKRKSSSRLVSYLYVKQIWQGLVALCFLVFPLHLSPLRCVVDKQTEWWICVQKIAAISFSLCRNEARCELRGVQWALVVVCSSFGGFLYAAAYMFATMFTCPADHHTDICSKKEKKTFFHTSL